MVTRRRLLQSAGRAAGAFGALSAFGGVTAIGLSSLASAVTVGEDGLHKQPWFYDSFMIVSEDIEESESAGKRFAMLFEQKGCPYCKQLHEVNFVDPDLVAYTKDHFNVLQVNIWGSREVTDVDGTVMEEKELARRWRVNFTPTMVFLPRVLPAGAESGRAIEVARMPGYFNPNYFRAMLEYVQGEVYERDTFQRFLQTRSQG
ncbi:MAG: thioredoxin family protein [Rhodospirillales bacterium]